MDIHYKNIKCADMSDIDIEATSKLFSEHYGIWSAAYGDKAGKKVSMSKNMIRSSFVNKEDCNVALAYHNDKLVGHTFYMRRKGSNFGVVTWILQLVVNSEYRGNSIGTKMLQSIFHLSDSYACGLYTSNPMTIKVLEEATMRKVNPALVEKHLDKLKSISKDLFKDPNWIDSYSNSMVDTKFYVDHSNLNENIKKAYPQGDFSMDPNLEEGKEWLAFTFRSQTPYIGSAEKLEKYLEYSNDILNKVYSWMKIEQHSWASHTKEEIDYIEKYFPQGCKVLDLGCGIGRHAIEIAKRNYNVLGVDFSEKHIQFANNEKQNLSMPNVDFICKSIFDFAPKEKYDVVLCLYDVVGSYPEEKNNMKILKKAYKCLKPNGVIILSVMNMTITKKRCKPHKNIVNGIEDHIDVLLKLEGTDTMSKTGDIFGGKHCIVDESTNIVYRKEQFFPNDALPIEYIVRDRRYTKSEIESIITNLGFSVIDSRYVKAGKFEIDLSEDKGKEILVVAKKNSRFSLLNNIQRFISKIRY